MDQIIATSETESSSQSSQLISACSRIICRVCQKQFSQYTCPRCNTRYCSLHCYKGRGVSFGKHHKVKAVNALVCRQSLRCVESMSITHGHGRMQHLSHSLRCTESFMRENVVEEMRQLRPDDESKKRMLEIIKRFHAEDEGDSMDEDEPTLSEETIQRVLSGGEINYDDLSSQEKKLFQRAIATGELSKMIEPWEPWWLKPSARSISLSHEGTRLIQPLSSEEPSGSHSVNTLENEIPPGPETSLPPLKNLTAAEPSPFLAFHLIDILYSYCFTLRLYNGDWESDSIGASMVVISVSSVLGQGSQPESILEAVSYCLEQTCSPMFKHMGGSEFGFGILDDVVSLISSGRAALVCALTDLQRMIKAGERELKSDKQKISKISDVKSKLKSAGRKLYFILCWVNEQQEEVWSSLSVLVTAEKAAHLELRDTGRKISSKTEKTNNESKSLVEEV